MKNEKSTVYSLNELEELFNANEDYKIGVRLMACIQVAKGASSRDLQNSYNMSYSRICHWVNRLNQLGIEGLKNAPKTGRKSVLADADLDRLKNILTKNQPSAYGYSQKSWNGTMVAELLKKEFNCDLKRATIYFIISRKLGLIFEKGKGFIPQTQLKTNNEAINN